MAKRRFSQLVKCATYASIPRQKRIRVAFFADRRDFSVSRIDDSVVGKIQQFSLQRVNNSFKRASPKVRSADAARKSVSPENNFPVAFLAVCGPLGMALLDAVGATGRSEGMYRQMLPGV